ncbi:MAG TPA: hypothetical protein PK324_08740, partial [Nocardioides sp.]|nr:hypothetical protein [Nocardioides sp.]
MPSATWVIGRVAGSCRTARLDRLDWNNAIQMARARRQPLMTDVLLQTDEEVASTSPGQEGGIITFGMTRAGRHRAEH